VQTIAASAATLHAHPEKIRGEYVIVVGGDDSPESTEFLESARLLLIDLQKHMSHKDAVEIVVKHTGLRRNQLYSLGLENTPNK